MQTAAYVGLAFSYVCSENALAFSCVCIEDALMFSYMCSEAALAFSCVCSSDALVSLKLVLPRLCGTYIILGVEHWTYII